MVRYVFFGVKQLVLIVAAFLPGVTLAATTIALTLHEVLPSAPDLGVKNELYSDLDDLLVFCRRILRDVARVPHQPIGQRCLDGVEE